MLIFLSCCFFFMLQPVRLATTERWPVTPVAPNVLSIATRCAKAPRHARATKDISDPRRTPLPCPVPVCIPIHILLR